MTIKNGHVGLTIFRFEGKRSKNTTFDGLLPFTLNSVGFFFFLVLSCEISLIKHSHTGERKTKNLRTQICK